MVFWLDASEVPAGSVSRYDLRPHRFSVDDDLFAQLGVQLFLGELVIARDDDSAVEEDDACQEEITFFLGLGLPRVRCKNDVVDVVLFELSISTACGNGRTLALVFLSYLPSALSIRIDSLLQDLLEGSHVQLEILLQRVCL
jgi:hypothetical protein